MNEWVTINQNDGPSARWGHASFYMSQKLYVFGGYADSQYMNDLWEYDLIKSQWRSLSLVGFSPEPRSNHYLLVDNLTQKIYLHGGGGKGKIRYGDIWILDLQNEKWIAQQSKGVPTTPRTYHSACIGRGHLFIYGGVNEFDLDQIEIMNLQTSTWLKVDINGRDKPQARRFCSLNYIDKCNDLGQIVLIGGCLTNYQPTTSIFIANIKLNDYGSVLVDWTKLQQRFQRWGHSAISYQNSIWICGGRSATEDIMDLVKFDLVNEFKQIKMNNEIAPRRKHSSILVGNSIMVQGGFNGEYLSDLNFIELQDPDIPSSSTFSHMMDNLFKSVEFSDLQIIHGSSTYNLHKFVLFAAFDQYGLTSEFTENVTNKSKQLGQKIIICHSLGKIMLQTYYETLQVLLHWTCFLEMNDLMLSLFNKNIEFTQFNFLTDDEQQRQTFEEINFVLEVKQSELFQQFKSINKNSPYLEVTSQLFHMLIEQLKRSENTFFVLTIGKYAKYWDVILTTSDNIHLKCNRAILALYSGFFNAMFSAPYKDSANITIQLQHIDSTQLIVKHIKYHKPFLFYFYTGCVLNSKDATQESFFNQYKLSQYLDMPTFTQKLKALIMIKISKENLFQTFENAIILEDESLQKNCAVIFTKINNDCNLKEITNQNSWVKQTIQTKINDAQAERLLPILHKKKDRIKSYPRNQSNKENQF